MFQTAASRAVYRSLVLSLELLERPLLSLFSRMENGLLFQLTKTGRFILMNILATIVWVNVIPAAPQHSLVAQKHPSNQLFPPRGQPGETLTGARRPLPALLSRMIHPSIHPDKQTNGILAYFTSCLPRPEIVHHFPLHQYVFLCPLWAFG